VSAAVSLLLDKDEESRAAASSRVASVAPRRRAACTLEIVCDNQSITEYGRAHHRRVFLFFGFGGVSTAVQKAAFRVLPLPSWMGSTHFQTRGLGRVATEMSLHVLAYNIKRVIGILGFSKAMQAMKMAGA
jgi:hypothetical protein